MAKASMHSFELDRARPSTSMIDTCAIVPILAVVYSAIVSPLILVISCPDAAPQCVLESRPEHKIFWPAMAAISVVLAARYRSRLGRLTLPPNIVCLLAYLAFAGASVLWAFNPELSFIRYAQQVMVITSIVLPAMLAVRTADLMRGLFLCFTFGSILNAFFVLGGRQTIVNNVDIGYSGYFTFKNSLGEFAAVALLLALHETLYAGRRRALGIIVVVIATLLLFYSNSKTPLGFAPFAAVLAGLTLITAKKMRISPAIVLLSVTGFSILCYAISPFNIYDVSQFLYGDRTFTARTFIWDFAKYEIGRSPLLGWGYQSFWLAGPDAPSIVDAPGFVKRMPTAHSGYLDTMLEMGGVGFAFLVIFIITTLHGIRHVADRAPARAWLLLSLALFIVLTNTLESKWMHGFDLLWVVFVVIAAEIARYWQPFHAGNASQHRHRSRLAHAMRRPTHASPQ